MSLASKLRYMSKPPRSSPNGDSTVFPMYSPPPPRKAVSSPEQHDIRARDRRRREERKRIIWVRVKEILFRVPESFFLNIPLETLRVSPSQGLTADDPICLGGHTVTQFRYILDAFKSYPSLNTRLMTLDQILTIGELSIRYNLAVLMQWFLPVLEDLVLSPATPLRKSSNVVYIRLMQLAMRYKRKDLVASISSKWVSRMHWGELDPLSALLFADMYGLRDLLGHACYVYLMSAEERIRSSEPIDPKERLCPRQLTYIMAGYHSLRTYHRHLRLTPPDITAAPRCKDHTKCIAVWKFRWSAAMSRPCSLPDVDVLGHLVFIEQFLREDTLLKACLTPACKEAALKAVSEKRDMIARQLHHHFDL